MKFLLLPVEASSASNRRYRHAQVLARTLHTELFLLGGSVEAPSRQNGIRPTGKRAFFSASQGQAAFATASAETELDASSLSWETLATFLSQRGLAPEEGMCILHPNQLEAFRELQRNFPGMQLLRAEDLSRLLYTHTWLVLEDEHAQDMRAASFPPQLCAADSLNMSLGTIKERGKGWFRMEIVAEGKRGSFSRFHFPEENLLPILNKYILEKGIQGLQFKYREEDWLKHLFSPHVYRYYPHLAGVSMVWGGE